MRWMRDIAVIVGIATVGLGFTGAREEQRSRDALLDSAARQTQTLERMIKCRAATKSGELNPRGWPITIDPSWFEHAPPTNPMLDDGEHPWVEVASVDDAALQNPTVRIAIDNSLAQFWYNPYQGVVRARVPVMVSDELAVDTYNQINGTNLKTIFDQEKSGDVPSAASATDAKSASAPTPAKMDTKAFRHERPKREQPMVRVHQATDEHTPPTPDHE